MLENSESEKMAYKSSIVRLAKSISKAAISDKVTRLKPAPG